MHPIHNHVCFRTFSQTISTMLEYAFTSVSWRTPSTEFWCRVSTMIAEILHFPQCWTCFTNWTSTTTFDPCWMLDFAWGKPSMISREVAPLLVVSNKSMNSNKMITPALRWPINRVCHPLAFEGKTILTKTRSALLLWDYDNVLKKPSCVDRCAPIFLHSCSILIHRTSWFVIFLINFLKRIQVNSSWSIRSSFALQS